MVGGDVYLDNPVALKVIILCGRHTHGSIFGQNDDAVVARADAYLVLSTYHSARFHTAQLRLLDVELLVAVVQSAAQVGHDDLLSGCHIGRAANYLAWFLAAKVHRGHVKMVAVGVHFAGEHFAYVESLEAAAYALHLFKGIYLQADRGQRVGNLLGSEVEINVFFQPFQ